MYTSHGFECSLDSRGDIYADRSHEEMEAYFTHKRSLKANCFKVNNPLSRLPSPPDNLVPFAQSLIASGDDVDCHIARLGQVLSTSFTPYFGNLSYFLHI